MTEVINFLQTLAISLTLILILFTLFWFVYAFRRMIQAFNKLMDELEKPRLAVSATATVTQSGCGHVEYQPTAQPPEPPENRDVVEDVLPLGHGRVKCHVCRAKLPEVPAHSKIEDEETILVYKCRRCGKETEVKATA